ncbi:MFS transporter [Enterococcus mundtii]|uniref:MFS transporter n=1 Tax=Enterococcus mundtii TaxID=53346 RepID=UPI002542DB27|nr:MFS transporter [Enterococcus mundtii]MDK4212277.1 MFS transporter [Enterococcus mundtii]
MPLIKNERDRLGEILQSIILKVDMVVKNKFQFIYFSQYALMAILMTQIVPFLTGQGYDAVQRGWFLASYSVTTIIFQIFIGYYSDRSKQLKKVSMVVSILFVCFAITFYLLVKDVWMIHLIVLAIAGGLSNTGATVLDNWVLSESEMRNNLAAIKAIGSLGWSVISVCIPFFIFNNNYQWLIVPFLFFLISYLYIAKTVPQTPQDKNEYKEQKSEEFNLSDMYQLCKNREFLCHTLLFFLLYLTIVANNTIVIDKLFLMDSGNMYVGLKWAIQAFCEIPAYLLLNHSVTKWKNERLLFISGFFLVLQFLVYATSRTPLVLLAASFLQFFTVPAFTIGSRMIISEITPKNVFSSGQLLSISVYMGLSSFVSPLLGGILAQQLSLDQALYFFSMLPIFAFICYYCYRKYQRNKRKI